jgi:hypothetical protein
MLTILCENEVLLVIIEQTSFYKNSHEFDEQVIILGKKLTVQRAMSIKLNG